MTKYEIFSLVIQGVVAIAAVVFGIFQISINHRLVKIQDYVALSIVPGNGTIKLLNTGKINLYIWGFEVNGNIKKLEKGRLISSASLDSSFYWLPIDFVPKESNSFEITIYLIDEFGEKYITTGGGNSEKVGEKDMRITVWTYKTIKSDWKF